MNLNENEQINSYEIEFDSLILIENNLPCPLIIELNNEKKKYFLLSNNISHEINLNYQNENYFSFSTDLFQISKPLILPKFNEIQHLKTIDQRVQFHDKLNRILFFQIEIVVLSIYQIQMIISIPFIFFNRTGLN